MNQKLAQFLIFIVTISVCSWSLFAYYSPNFGREYTTSVLLKKYLESSPIGIVFALGAFVCWIFWEGFKIRENSNFGLNGWEFWLIISASYLLGHALWGI